MRKSVNVFNYTAFVLDFNLLPAKNNEWYVTRYIFSNNEWARCPIETLCTLSEVHLQLLTYFTLIALFTFSPRGLSLSWFSKIQRKWNSRKYFSEFDVKGVNTFARIQKNFSSMLYMATMWHCDFLISTIKIFCAKTRDTRFDFSNFVWITLIRSRLGKRIIDIHLRNRHGFQSQAHAPCRNFVICNTAHIMIKTSFF